MTHADMVKLWEDRLAVYAKLEAHVSGRALAKQVLEDLERITDSETAVTLTQASKQTGYSADHLSRLIRDGKLTNHGRKHAPAVRVSECPKKTTLAPLYEKAYNPETDARSLLSARRLRRTDNAS